ncbi:MAG: 50S ribosomal protein L13 [Planctomycetes bacterium]|nr:50S ribosomal protein L13 [Planctomycetota bacterium]
MKTVLTRKEDVDRRWYHIDASDAVLGKLAVKVARLLMGKDKTIWTPGVDVGDFVVVTQADRVKVTGRKETGKVYRRYTGYAGGLREASLGELREKKPEKVIELAVRRMLPKTRLGRAMLRRLKIYAGAEHEHAAQKPQTIQLASTQK